MFHHGSNSIYTGQVPGVKSDVIYLEHVMTAIIIQIVDESGWGRSMCAYVSTNFGRIGAVLHVYNGARKQ